jgi:hypothetical protein
VFKFWKRRASAPSNPRATRELDSKELSESVKHRDLFELLELFLVRRVQTELELEEKRAEVKLKTAEADAQSKLKLEEIRVQRKQLRASQMAERNRTAPRDAKGRITRDIRAGGACPVCTDPGNAFLTVEMIRHHKQEGHGGIPNNGQPVSG